MHLSDHQINALLNKHCSFDFWTSSSIYKVNKQTTLSDAAQGLNSIETDLVDIELKWIQIIVNLLIYFCFSLVISNHHYEYELTE